MDPDDSINNGHNHGVHGREQRLREPVTNQYSIIPLNLQRRKEMRLSFE